MVEHFISFSHLRIHELSKINLAACANSTLKHQHTLMLVNAANDVITMLIQEDEYKQFLGMLAHQVVFLQTKY